MKKGDLVRVREDSINSLPAAWFGRYANEPTPMLVVDDHIKGYLKLLRPNKSFCWIKKDCLTTKF